MIVYLLCIKRKNWYHPRGRASTRLPSCGDLALSAGGDVSINAGGKLNVTGFKVTAARTPVR
jgi:hypothetical protein